MNHRLTDEPSHLRLTAVGRMHVGDQTKRRVYLSLHVRTGEKSVGYAIVLKLNSKNEKFSFLFLLAGKTEIFQVFLMDSAG